MDQENILSSVNKSDRERKTQPDTLPRGGHFLFSFGTRNQDLALATQVLILLRYTPDLWKVFSKEVRGTRLENKRVITAVEKTGSGCRQEMQLTGRKRQVGEGSLRPSWAARLSEHDCTMVSHQANTSFCTGVGRM